MVIISYVLWSDKQKTVMPRSLSPHMTSYAPGHIRPTSDKALDCLHRTGTPRRPFLLMIIHSIHLIAPVQPDHFFRYSSLNSLVDFFWPTRVQTLIFPQD